MISSSIFSKLSGSNGGAIYFETESILSFLNLSLANGSIEISESTFSYNSASSYGGALYLVIKKFNFDNTQFFNNEAGVFGGAGYLNSPSSLIDITGRFQNLEFKQNRAHNGNDFVNLAMFSAIEQTGVVGSMMNLPTQLRIRIFKYYNGLYYGTEVDPTSVTKDPRSTLLYDSTSNVTLDIKLSSGLIPNLIYEFTALDKDGNPTSMVPQK